MTEPTSLGLLRYPLSKGYFVFRPGVWMKQTTPEYLACVCVDTCPAPCEGDCGCQACIWRDAEDHMVGQTFPRH
jgi:hypothetical protein